MNSIKENDIKILGIGGSRHDFSFCYLENGIIISAIAEERLSREKNSLGPRSKMFRGINYCLSSKNLSIDDVDLIVTNDLCECGSLAKPQNSFLHNIISINHHMAHASAAYYQSGFDKAACLVIDANGSLYNNGDIAETISYGIATNGKINLNNTVYSQVNQYETNSLGQLYLYITYQCGFCFGQEGKTMGLAAYGNDRFLSEMRNNINPSMNDYINAELVQCIQDIFKKYGSDFQVKADIAYATQQILEENVFRIMNDLYNRFKCKNLCYAGGIALNSVLNGKIKDNTSFENVFVFPAAGDCGTSVGAALYGYHQIYQKPYIPNKKICNVYFGNTYSDDKILDQLSNYNDLIFFEKKSHKSIIKETAKDISDGKIIGWFQNGSEFGPRALGNRSILADPRDKDMKDILNKKIKFRETFRPFAPVIMEEYICKYIDTRFNDNPFMLYVGSVQDEVRHVIPSAIHIDGTARFQSISRDNNAILYELLQEFMKITGVPILINTSFNTKGMPIVENPSDALKCLLNSNLDKVVIHDYVIQKK